MKTKYQSVVSEEDEEKQPIISAPPPERSHARKMLIIALMTILFVLVFIPSRGADGRDDGMEEASLLGMQRFKLNKIVVVQVEKDGKKTTTTTQEQDDGKNNKTATTKEHQGEDSKEEGGDDDYKKYYKQYIKQNDKKDDKTESDNSAAEKDETIYHSANIEERVIEDYSYVDVNVDCKEAFFSPIFHNILDLLRLNGIVDVTRIGEDQYHFTFGGMDVEAYVHYDDDYLIYTLVMLKGFQIFETLTEHITFKPLPSYADDGRDITDAHSVGPKRCRIVRNYVAVIPLQNALLNVTSFFRAVDPELIRLRDALEARNWISNAPSLAPLPMGTRSKISRKSGRTP
jgi:hypothetical protein